MPDTSDNAQSANGVPVPSGQSAGGSEQNAEPPVAKRLWGKYRGTVVDNQDAPPSGRLLVSVPGIVITNWAMPCVPLTDIAMGTFMRPRIGANVWVEFERGDPDMPIWVGCWWGEGEIPAIAEEYNAVPAISVMTIESSQRGHLHLRYADAGRRRHSRQRQHHRWRRRGNDRPHAEQRQHHRADGDDHDHHLQRRHARGGVHGRMSMIEIAFPYGLETAAARPPLIYNNHVEQMLELLLLTRPGERVNLPTFGCGLLDQVFAPNSPEIAAALNVTIAAAINLWLQDVVSLTSLDVSVQENQLNVNIAYTVLPTGSPASLTLSVPGGP